MRTLTIVLFTLFHFFGFSQEKSTITEIKVIPESSDSEISEVPFAIIEDVPVFPGCGELDRKERLTCFQEKLNEHIIKNLKYPKQARKKNIQGKVITMFVINKEGIIENIVARGPENCEDCEILEKEAIRIMSKLPRMTPGKQKGKAVKVKYSQPLNFKLQ